MGGAEQDAQLGMNVVVDVVHGLGLNSYLEDGILGLGGDVPEGGFADQRDALRRYAELAFADVRVRAYYCRTAFPGWLPDDEVAIPTDADILAAGVCLLCGGDGRYRDEEGTFDCPWCNGSGTAIDMMEGFRYAREGH